MPVFLPGHMVIERRPSEDARCPYNAAVCSSGGKEKNGSGGAEHGAAAAFEAAAPQPQPSGRSSTLLGDDGTAQNCVENADQITQADVAHGRQDSLAFLGDVAPGQITDPSALGGEPTYASLARYIPAAHAHGHSFSVAATAPEADVARVLSLPQSQRAADIAQHAPASSRS